MQQDGLEVASWALPGLDLVMPEVELGSRC